MLSQNEIMREIKDKEEIKKTKYYLEEAAKEATKSHCRKSARGAVIVKNNEIIGSGYNKVTDESLCNPCIREYINDNSRAELCSAIHAEQMAILNASKNGLTDSIMYHIKIKNSLMVPSGKPSCTVCSRIILESGVKEFVLWHKDGYFAYNPQEINKLSFEYLLNQK